MPDRPLGAAAALATALGVTAAIALTGCGGASGPSPAARAAYLQALHDADPLINQVRSDESLVRLGEAACADYSSGASFSTVAEQLASGAARLSSEDLGALLTAAVEDLCPKYRSEAGVS